MLLCTITVLAFASTGFASFPGTSPGNGRIQWIYPHTTGRDQPFSSHSKSIRGNPIQKIQINQAWTPQMMQEQHLRPRFAEKYSTTAHFNMAENSRVHMGRLLFPGWNSKVLNTQHFEDPHYRWISKAKDGSSFIRHVHQLPQLTNFIEESRVLPVKQAMLLRQAMLHKFAPTDKHQPTRSTKKSSTSSIEAPHYAAQKAARFAQTGLTAGVGAGVKTGAKDGGADPWWLNPPPWWLPPPPEWGSPPPSVYSPFYSPASIQQPVSTSPAHNSYPVYTPTPPPY